MNDGKIVISRLGFVAGLATCMVVLFALEGIHPLLAFLAVPALLALLLVDGRPAPLALPGNLRLLAIPAVAIGAAFHTA